MEIIAVEEATVDEGPPLAEMLLGSGFLGVLYGGSAGIALVAFSYFGGGFAEGATFMDALPVAAALGIVSGAIVAMVAALTESVPGGMGSAVIIDGVLRLLVLHTSGYWWGLTPGGLLATVIASVAVGVLVSRQVLNSPQVAAEE